VLHLKGAETIVGRRNDCDLRILSSQVSRRHCMLTIHDGALSVEDLDSVNGTIVNGKRISRKCQLDHGDIVEIGPLRFVVDAEPTGEMPALAGRAAEEADEELEVLPVAEDAHEGRPVVLTEDDQELDALPIVDEETEFVAKAVSDSPEHDDDADVIPLADDLEASGDWNPAQQGDLRSILSEMDEGDNKPKKKKK
jgi:predicted component of type VI protein secretion system